MRKIKAMNDEIFGAFLKDAGLFTNETLITVVNSGDVLMVEYLLTRYPETFVANIPIMIIDYMKDNQCADADIVELLITSATNPMYTNGHDQWYWIYQLLIMAVRYHRADIVEIILDCNTTVPKDEFHILVVSEYCGCANRNEENLIKMMKLLFDRDKVDRTKFIASVATHVESCKDNPIINYCAEDDD